MATKLVTDIMNLCPAGLGLNPNPNPCKEISEHDQFSTLDP